MCYLEKEKGRKNLSKRWAQVRYINKDNAFDAAVATVNLELAMVGRGLSGISGIRGPPSHLRELILPRGYEGGRIWSMGLVPPVGPSELHYVSANCSKKSLPLAHTEAGKADTGI